MTTPQQRANQLSAASKEEVKRVQDFSREVSDKSMSAEELQKAWESKQE